MPLSKTASTRKAKRRDKIARWIITLGGIAVIASVIVIIALIVGVTLPLFQSPRAIPAADCHLAKTTPVDDVLQVSVDMPLRGNDAIGTVWLRDGTVVWLDLPTGKELGRSRLTSPGVEKHAALVRVDPAGPSRYSAVWSDGGASLVDLVIHRSKSPGHPEIHAVAQMPPEKANAGKASVSKTKAPPPTFLRRAESGAVTRATLLPNGTIDVLRQVRVETPLGDEETKTLHHVIQENDVAAHICAMTMDRDGNTLYAGTDDGRLLRWRFDDDGDVAQREVVRAFSDGRAVTALATLLGDVSLAVGDAKGGVTIWSPVNADGTRKLRMVHLLESHKTAIRQILPSGRNKSLVSVSEDGDVHWDYATSERHLASVASKSPQPFRYVAFAPRGDGLLGLDAAGQLAAWRLASGSPEISLKTLFGAVQYEGYDAPDYVWQTTGGEDFEPKYSLVPLLFGTFKGTLYAMIFAGPLALFGAMYVSYFTTPGFRKAIKPIIEIMATVPSVVIGFLIALWLAPILQHSILAFFLSLATVPMTFFIFMGVWQMLRRYDWAKRVESGYEFLVMLPVLLVGVAAAVYLAPPLDAWLFHAHYGSFRQWLFQGPLHMQYDQRNCIIVAFGLGFAVIPIIFSIAEDALSNVPYNMTAASMALGASRWQTLWRVVLPSASPGIFAAVMIGFGRAVGETMIVLMATGNTPITDWSPLNGMRTLSANIAVEISEAPEGGTLYRVLFLCAVLLFVLTFAINTAAELVRQRLRNRYGKF